MKMNNLMKLLRDPFGLLGRLIYKIFFAPLKYRERHGYDAEKYWQDRFSKYGLSMKGVGDEGLSEEDNERMYQEAAQAFLALCQRERIDFPNTRVLEIGCGNGFYAHLLAEQKVQSYVGVDITDVFFPELEKKHPDFEFVRKDVTADELNGEFDLIIMIDVIEHITTPDKLKTAFDNVKGHLAKGSIFMVAPVSDKSKRSLFYVRFWSLDDIAPNFVGFKMGEPVPFRHNHILAIKKP
jgi:2-polyprenyl-3-methyl-5-hydroxy-6-metoxy-1,4-benzoquinol methylase